MQKTMIFSILLYKIWYKLPFTSCLMINTMTKWKFKVWGIVNNTNYHRSITDWGIKHHLSFFQCLFKTNIVPNKFDARRANNSVFSMFQFTWNSTSYYEISIWDNLEEESVFPLLFYAILRRKLQNTVLGYKKRSKSKSEKSYRLTTPTLYMVLLYDFAHKSVWDNLEETSVFPLLFYVILRRK